MTHVTGLGSCLTHKWRLSRDSLAGFEDELALVVRWETLVQQQDPRTVCGTGGISDGSSSQTSSAAPAIPNVAHLDAEGKLVA